MMPDVVDTLGLADPSLLTGSGFVDGMRFKGDRLFRVANPATGALLAEVADMGVPELRSAIDAAHAARKAWAARTAKDRAAILRRWHDGILANREDLARILTAEMGKPLAEARGEIAYGAAYVEWFAEEARRVYGDTIPGHMPDKRIIVLKQPVGVVGAITPWNFPNAMLARKIAPALAAGCTVVARPSEFTPLSALALGVLAERAGVPAGVLNIVPGLDAAGMGAELCANPKVAKISFTGSTRVGRILMRQGAETIKKLSLELGGNAPFIVFDDADLDAAVDGAMAAKFRNAGQTCICANRIYVQAGLHDAFVEKLAARVAALTVGEGQAEGVAIGPLINRAALAKVEDHIADARIHGATIATGGTRHALGGTFFQPTVLSGMTQAMKIAREETFGPVAPVWRFETEDEVVALANASEFGLAGYFYARDISRVWRVAEALEVGMVGVNTGLISTEVAPFGGIKQSGLGREGSHYGIEDYLDIKYMCLSV
ncbi:succinate-semialdehyde dehydrogenase [Paracoccus sp. YIM 132242]|uniref:Succinate-semialdehyde dehydrogenase n=1 Tax=Paracoccus lichenicola TaxID=2665644 RepID=A0A6L6HQG0_9RHOB|nr:NAD-dependent succinate-semialdehyde dehydrogenase [Paracoccus lichenicola]MTE00540.1 succinate-semialdehyde dehydrogenase [Paracoccus lichenicola]